MNFKLKKPLFGILLTSAVILLASCGGNQTGGTSDAKILIVNSGDQDIPYDDNEERVDMGNFAFSNIELPDHKSLKYGRAAIVGSLNRTTLPDECLYVGAYPTDLPADSSVKPKWEHVVIKVLENGHFRKMKARPGSNLENKLKAAVTNGKFETWQESILDAPMSHFVEENEKEIIAQSGDTPLKTEVSYYSQIVFRLFNENWEFDDSLDSIEVSGTGSGYKFNPFYGPLDYGKDSSGRVKTVSVKYYRDPQRITNKNCEYYYNVNVIVKENIPEIPANSTIPGDQTVAARQLITKLKIDPIIKNNGTP